ncbi:MAG: ATP-binding protein [Bacteroidales bacterium]|nr:ATP-binding protein [Bacteroidales bacterium]
MKKIPIGIQAFSSLIDGDFVYLDKTDMIFKIATTKACYFLSRPRRFGKSLTLSTLHTFFDGRKELFAGLKIEKLETKWEKYPVLHFDFNASTYNSVEDVQSRIGYMLSQHEKIFGKDDNAKQNSERFESLINAAAAQTGKNVVILVDEYDKPLLSNISNKDLQDEIRKELKAFYGVLKTCDENIKIAFITGVTKFSKVSLFSDVNNLIDISAEINFSTLCGATEQEIHDYLDCYVQEMADANDITKDECYKELKNWYEGYHFHPNSVDVYNPFGLMRALYSKEFKEYWFETGTPTFLVEEIKRHNMNLRDLDNVRRTEEQLSKIDNVRNDPVPLLYQSGYLTIKGYDKFLKRYTLSLPNKEVGEALPKFILNFNFPQTDGGDFDITNFIEDVFNGDIDGFMKRLCALLADNNYEIVGDAEKYFQNVFYLIFKLLGFYAEVERNTSDGRMDAVVKTPQYIYVFEFKLDKPAQEALDQINSKDYFLPFSVDGRKLFKVGVSFSSETRKVKEWVKE